jgi:hypothetical protein
MWTSSETTARLCLGVEVRRSGSGLEDTVCGISRLEQFSVYADYFVRVGPIDIQRNILFWGDLAARLGKLRDERRHLEAAVRAGREIPAPDLCRAGSES